MGLFNIDALENYVKKRLTNQSELLLDQLCTRIADTPTIEAESVKHGQWVEHLEMGYDGSCNGIIYECSICHEFYGDIDGYNYCPNCGKKMDGETDVC